MGKLFPAFFMKKRDGFCFCSYSQDRLVIVLTPALRSAQGTRICSQLKSCTVTDFWLRDSLYPMTFAALSQGLRRDTAPVPPTKILYRDRILAPIKLVPLTMLRMSGLSARHPDARFTRSGLKARNAHKNLYLAYFAKATEAKRRQKVRPRLRFTAAGQSPPPCTPWRSLRSVRVKDVTAFWPSILTGR